MASFLLIAIAIGWTIIPIMPEGEVILALNAAHGIHAGDLPILVLLLIAGWLALT